MPLEEKPWGLRAVAFVGGIIVTSLSLSLSLVLGAYKAGWVSEGDLPQIEALVEGVSFYLVGLVVIYLFLKNRGISLNQAFGLDRKHWSAALGQAAVLCLMVLPAVWAATYVWREVLLVFGISPKEQDILELFKKTKSPLLRAYFIGLAIVLAPVFEECFFRGFVYPALKRHLHIAGALLVVSVLFALVHLNASAFGPLCVLAALLGLAYETTGSLLVPITIHSLFNALNLAILFFATDQ